MKQECYVMTEAINPFTNKTIHIQYQAIEIECEAYFILCIILFEGTRFGAILEVRNEDFNSTYLPT